jgi:ribosomal protein S18 acetylase RimI-like enzyme
VDITFRNATLDDMDFYFLIRKETIRPYIQKYSEWDEEKEYGDILAKINPGRDKVILSAGREIGLLSISESETTIYIDLLNIVAEYQCRGLGTLILSSVIEDGLRKSKSIRLDTYQSNTRAISFYLRNGFETVGHMNGRYPKMLMEYKMNMR